MQFRILSADDVCKALPMANAIEGMKMAYAQLSGYHVRKTTFYREKP